jgi:hypothetical protein
MSPKFIKGITILSTLLKSNVFYTNESLVNRLGLKHLDSVSNVPRLDQVGIFLYDEDFEDEVLMDSNYIVPNRAKNIFVRVLVPQKGIPLIQLKGFLRVKLIIPMKVFSSH